MTPHMAIVQYPALRCFVWNSERILTTDDARWFDKHFGKRHALRDLARRHGLPRYSALTFADGTQHEPLTPDDNGNLEINGVALYALLWNAAARRPGSHTVIDPRDLKQFFEMHTSGWSNAHGWVENVLLHLITGTPLDTLPKGASQRLSVTDERQKHGPLWAEAASLFDGPA